MSEDYPEYLTDLRHQHDLFTDGLSDHDQITALRMEVRVLTRRVEDLITAWETAKGIVALVRWLGGLAVAAAVLWGALWHGSINK